MGIQCEYEGNKLYLGNRKLLEEKNYKVPEEISEQVNL